MLVTGLFSLVWMQQNMSRKVGKIIKSAQFCYILTMPFFELIYYQIYEGEKITHAAENVFKGWKNDQKQYRQAPTCV